MKKETLFIAFSTQKGGVGKTTFTVLAASYLHYLKGYNVAVLDCDFPQYSINAMRKRDTQQVEADDYYKLMAYNQFNVYCMCYFVWIRQCTTLLTRTARYSNHSGNCEWNKSSTGIIWWRGYLHLHAKR